MNDRDYAELSQLAPVPSESHWRITTASSVNGRVPPPATDGLALGNSALNARYMSGQQVPALPATVTYLLIHGMLKHNEPVICN